MSAADLKLLREGLIRLYSVFNARGDKRAAEECVTCAQIITRELRPAALLAPKAPQ